MIGGITPGEWLVTLGMLAAGVVLVAVPAGMICRKAGLHPALGLLAIVPIANVVLLWVVAFKAWPSQSSTVR